MHTDICCPARPGAYVLVIDLNDPVTFRVAGGRDVRLAAGRYAYCGSARGPGGLQARIGRHLRREKRPHWHVDHLTTSGRIAAIGICLDGMECDLFDRIVRLPGARIPAPGLGSSDCGRCLAHLAAVDPAFAPATIGLEDVAAA